MLIRVPDSKALAAVWNIILCAVRNFLLPWGPALLPVSGILLVTGLQIYISYGMLWASILLWVLAGVSLGASIALFVYGYWLAKRREEENKILV
jgi:hypothetical protein